ncbi:MAG: ATP-dependent Clp protease ATP-binding subunit ClpX [Christensenellaceae bacterium]|jgi:ATP-dependent Clp protease ATP-binding subunit ClpX|nr:ATP-dependent Clp protease ATP-binding subunit ClpX [Christensenellaceae bacterium]
MSQKQLQIVAPAEIKARLDEYVVGQEDAKRVLSVAVYNHYKRANYAVSEEGQNGGVKLVKSNILIVGPTGSGKTYVTSTLARTLSVPFVVADATTFITTGIKAESHLTKLIEEAKGDIKMAERGIIYIDEVDKISKRYRPSNEGIQQALLRFIEGSVYTLPTTDGGKIEIDTSNILFIVGGAFVGLSQLIQMRTETASSIKTESDLIKDAKPEDFAQFGFIPEFIGRIPVIVSLQGFDRQALMDILTEPKDALITQYKKIFAIDGIEIIFERDALETIADKAMLAKTGARGLRGVIENAMRDIMYKAPGEQKLKKIIITAGVISGDSEPIYEYEWGNIIRPFPPIPPNPSFGKSIM